MATQPFQFNLKTALYLMFVFAAVLGGFLAFMPKSVSHGQIAKITEGMTEAQVIAQLGPSHIKEASVWGYRYFHDPFHCTFFIRFDANKKVEVFVGEIDNMPAGFPPGKHGRNSDKRALRSN